LLVALISSTVGVIQDMSMAVVMVVTTMILLLLLIIVIAVIIIQMVVGLYQATTRNICVHISDRISVSYISILFGLTAFVVSDC